MGGSSAPHTPEDLINMQASSASPSRPDKPTKNDKTTLKTKQALNFLEKLELSPAEDKPEYYAPNPPTSGAKMDEIRYFMQKLELKSTPEEQLCRRRYCR